MDANDFFESFTEKIEKLNSKSLIKSTSSKFVLIKHRSNKELRKNRSVKKLHSNQPPTKPSSIKITDSYKPWGSTTVVNRTSSFIRFVKKVPKHFSSSLNYSQTYQYRTTFQEASPGKASIKDHFFSQARPVDQSPIKEVQKDATSKWFFYDGSFEWRPCKAIKYCRQSEKYMICLLYTSPSPRDS